MNLNDAENGREKPAGKLPVGDRHLPLLREAWRLEGHEAPRQPGGFLQVLKLREN